MYKTSHELFIDMMNDYIKLEKTISELQAFSGKRIADKEFNVSVELLVNGDKNYHYALPNIFERHCHYYLLVDSKTQRVKGWGFDKDKSDPKINCGASG